MAWKFWTYPYGPNASSVTVKLPVSDPHPRLSPEIEIPGSDPVRLSTSTAPGYVVPTLSFFPSGAASSSVQKFPSAAVTPTVTVFSSERLTNASVGVDSEYVLPSPM